MVKLKDGVQLYTMPPSPRVLKVSIEINRDNLLDEAIFLAICGRNHGKEGSSITGVVRLGIARDILTKVIQTINKKD